MQHLYLLLCCHDKGMADSRIRVSTNVQCSSISCLLVATSTLLLAVQLAPVAQAAPAPAATPQTSAAPVNAKPTTGSRAGAVIKAVPAAVNKAAGKFKGPAPARAEPTNAGGENAPATLLLQQQIYCCVHCTCVACAADSRNVDCLNSHQ